MWTWCVSRVPVDACGYLGEATRTATSLTDAVRWPEKYRLPSPVLTGAGSRVCGSARRAAALSARLALPCRDGWVVLFSCGPDSTSGRVGTVTAWVPRTRRR